MGTIQGTNGLALSLLGISAPGMLYELRSSIATRFFVAISGVRYLGQPFRFE